MSVSVRIEFIPQYNIMMTKAFREILNKAANEMYAYIKSQFQEHPGKKMVFSHPVGYRKYTEIAPFGTYLEYEKCESTGEWVKVDSGKGAGHLMALEHYIHGERWCSKALEHYCDTIEELMGLIRIIDFNDRRKQLKEKDPERFGDKITFDWVDNDMAEKHWCAGL